MTNQRSFLPGLLGFLFLLTGCNAGPNLTGQGQTLGATSLGYAQIQANIITPKCLSCHSSALASGGLSLADYPSILSAPGAVVPYQPYQSAIYKKTVNGEMPPGGSNLLTAAELQSLYNWLALGAQNN